MKHAVENWWNVEYQPTCMLADIMKDVDDSCKYETFILIIYTINFYKHLFIDIDNCQPNRCQNGGSCTDLVKGYTCSCAAGYTGDNCEAGNMSLVVA